MHVKIVICVSAFLVGTLLCNAQTVSEKDTLMLTYPYSAESSLPQQENVYPYTRFTGFTAKSEMRNWKMVVLENEFLRVKLFPEIGGKVWSVYDKKKGREMFYDNDVVKFREIAIRGPWTSGGIEFNYGVIGHSPTCSSPVDYCVSSSPDGTVSCFIGALEMISRSRWVVEISLRPGDRVLRTRSFWYNLSDGYGPLYSWANAAVETTADMRLVYPSDGAVGHKGQFEAYPVDEEGRDVSFFSNQAYGADKSYHMIGSHHGCFGVYYPSADWGVMHSSLRDEKIGRKYFAWSQSREGDIWKDLLTDGRPQYIEMQSGRLINQNRIESSRNTNYRQILFAPYSTEEWTDEWFSFDGSYLQSLSDPELLDRPKVRAEAFDTLSVQASLLMARDCIGLNLLREAEEYADKALAADSYVIDGLWMKSFLLWRKADCQAAYDYSSRALELDFYSPEANYYGGLAADALGRRNDALDRLETCALSPGELRPAALTAIARIYLKEGDTSLAANYARKALVLGSHNITALQILCKAGGVSCDSVSQLDPLSHFPAAEAFLSGRMGQDEFSAGFRSEMAWQDFLELAVFYHGIGRDAEASVILKACPVRNALVGLWTAFLDKDASAVSAACNLPVEFVFPFRRESVEPLKWAVSCGEQWQSRYLLALLENHLGCPSAALSLLDSDNCGFAPYYYLRHLLSGDSSDAGKACVLDADNAEYAEAYSNALLREGRGADAVNFLKTVYRRHPDNCRIGIALVDSYIAVADYSAAEKIIDRITILPYEGLRGPHNKWRYIKLNLAAIAADKGQYGKAERLVRESLDWPERLGAGKPYDDCIDRDAEDWLSSEIEKRKSGKGPFEPLSGRIPDVRNNEIID